MDSKTTSSQSEDESKGLCCQDLSTNSSSTTSPAISSNTSSSSVTIENVQTIPKSENTPQTTNTPKDDSNQQIDDKPKDSPTMDSKYDLEMANIGNDGYEPVSQTDTPKSPADNKHRHHAHSVATPPPIHAKDISDPKIQTQWELFKEVNRVYFYDPGQKTFGERMRLDKVGLWFYFICFLVPILFNAFFFGVLPMGDPDSKRLWVLTVLITPATMTAVAYLNTAAFLGCLGVERPFRVHWKILVGVYVTVAGVATALGLWKMYGVAIILLTFAATFFGNWVHERWKIHSKGANYCTALDLFSIRYKQYLKVLVCLIVFFFCLIGYVFAYEHSSDAQRVVPFALAIVTFIIRKTMLSLTDPFGLEIAMLISGFWVQNMQDMLQLLVFPYVKKPVYYLSIWGGNWAGNVANLLFLTDTWFVFRVWIKAFLSHLFKCNPMCHPPEAKIEMDEVADERGHSNNKPGYHRRQVRFYTWKILSQMIASVFYLVTSTVLRFGYNKRHYPFARNTEDQYHNSLIFAAANLGNLKTSHFRLTQSAWVASAGFVGFLYVRSFHKETWNQMWKISRKLFFNHVYIGFIIAIAACNGVLALTLLVDNSKIYQYIVDNDDD